MSTTNYSIEVLRKLGLKRYWYITPRDDGKEYLDLKQFMPKPAATVEDFKLIDQDVPVSVLQAEKKERSTLSHVVLVPW